MSQSSAMWEFGRSSDDEGLRLILAFFQITDPNVRLSLIETAEAAAANSVRPIEPLSLLKQDNRPQARPKS